MFGAQGEPVTPLALSAIAARAEAATAGPWAEDDGCVQSVPVRAIRDAAITRRVLGDKALPHPDPDNGYPLGYVCSCPQVVPLFEKNAAFIAAARSDVPLLVARVRELEIALEGIDLAADLPGDFGARVDAIGMIRKIAREALGRTT